MNATARTQMKKPALVVSILLIALITPISQAQLYKWVDDQGNVHYGDSPPENADLKEITGEITSFTTTEVEPFKFDPNLITAPEDSKSVVMYSTAWCGYCKKAAKYFRRKNIRFKEYDIEKSEKAARDYKRLKGRGVPLILVGKNRMTGFNQATFDRIYYGS